MSDATLFTSIRQLTQVAPVYAVQGGASFLATNKSNKHCLLLKITAAYFPSFALSQPPARYWQEPQKEGTDENKVGKHVKETDQALQRKEKKTQKAKKRKQEEAQRDGKKFISGV